MEAPNPPPNPRCRPPSLVDPRRRLHQSSIRPTRRASPPGLVPPLVSPRLDALGALAAGGFGVAAVAVHLDRVRNELGGRLFSPDKQTPSEPDTSPSARRSRPGAAPPATGAPGGCYGDVKAAGNSDGPGPSPVHAAKGRALTRALTRRVCKRTLGSWSCVRAADAHGGRGSATGSRPRAGVLP